MRALHAAVLAVGIVCLIAGRAEAASDEARLGWFLPIARAAWPASPCAGRETVTLRGDAGLRDVAAQLQAPQLDGAAWPSECRVLMASSLTPTQFCVVLTHELGHLAGREHTATHGDVMNGDGFIDWAPCRRAVAQARARRRA